MATQLLNPDMGIAYDLLKSRSESLQKYFDYYDGDQHQIYLSTTLRALFRRLSLDFTENWIAVVVDQTVDRINIHGVKINGQGNEAAQSDFDRIWNSGMGLQADDAHESAIIAGLSQIIAWPAAQQAEGPGVVPGPLAGLDSPPIEVYHQLPTMCAIQYDTESPQIKRWATKWWTNDEGRLRLKLYYPDRMEDYVSRGEAEKVTDAGAFVPYVEPGGDEMGHISLNPFGMIPVFELRCRGRNTNSDLKPCLPIQDAVNVSLQNLMASAEFAAFTQKYLIGNVDIADGVLRMQPNTIWQVPQTASGETPIQIGEFSSAQLGSIIQVIDRAITSMSAISRVPKHYFQSTGVIPSGEALYALEQPLVAKCRNRMERFTPEWKSLIQFVCMMLGHAVRRDDIEIVWDDPATSQPGTAAQLENVKVGTAVTAKLPQTEVWKRMGYTPEQMGELATAYMKDALLNAVLAQADAIPPSGPNGSEFSGTE